MKSKADLFIDKVLGEDFYESLTKFELWKPGTKTVVDHEEIKTALMIVPRTIIALLIKELVPMAVDSSKTFKLEVGKDVEVHVTKHERDVYSGTVNEENKVLVDFKNRSVPGLGLVIMSAFELYDEKNLMNSDKPEKTEDHDSKIAKLIDERLALREMVGHVVEEKLKHRDAVHSLVLNKLTEAVAQKHEDVKEGNKFLSYEQVNKLAKGTDKLKSFIEKTEKKNKKNEFSIQLAKGEQVNCPDCGKHIFSEGLFSGCICLGDDMNRKIFIKKSESGVKIRFGRGWDEENIELLLELLRRNRG